MLKTDREYTKNMQKVAKSSKNIPIDMFINYSYAGLLTIMVVAQLFKFDEFINLISKNSGVGGGVAFSLAAMAIVFEMMAIPYLINLRMLRQVRMISLISIMMVGMFWVVMAFSIGMVRPADNIGFFSSIVAIKPGVVAVALSTVIASLSVYASRKFLFIVKK